jgi:PrtD family type I secretion system ABC transporter
MMREGPSERARSSSDPTELERAVKACRSAFATCALFSLVINLLMLVSPIYMLQVYDRVLTTGRIETLVMLTLIATLALAVMCALDALRTAVTIRVGCWLNERLGPAYLACAVRGRLKGDSSGVEHLRDISQLQNFVATQGLTAFFDAPWVPIFVGLIWILHPMLGVVALSAAVVLFVLSIANEFATRKATETANKKQIEATALADATIRNAEIVQAMHMLPAMTARWSAVNGAVVDGLRRAGDVGGFVLATTKFVRFFVQVAILAVGAWLVVNSQLTAGAMIAGSILLGRALAPVELAISMWRNFMGARFSYDRLKKAIEEHPAPPRRTTLPAPGGSVEVDGVSYLTPNTAQLIISTVSCAVASGEALAIIGPSGAGKSTLCRLMVGLALPNVGEIRLDGSPIHHWDSEQIGRHIGFLPQGGDARPCARDDPAFSARLRHPHRRRRGAAVRRAAPAHRAGARGVRQPALHRPRRAQRQPRSGRRDGARAGDRDPQGVGGRPDHRRASAFHAVGGEQGPFPQGRQDRDVRRA